MGDRRQRLDAAIKRRDQLRSTVQRVQGRLEGARSELEAVETECREKGVEPEMLDTAIERLTDRYESVLSDLETGIQTAEQALQPYVGEATE
jgi:DNA repair exonuclease SbcCD ATPase subunit